MKQIIEIANKNQQRAQEIIKDTNIIGIWESIGARINIVGSLGMGLLMKHLDFDFHIYTNPINITQSFGAVAKLAENKNITHIEYTNLIDTDEQCIEWHAWYKDCDNQLWQIDMIHILAGSKYDGYFENVAKTITNLLTEETRNTILRLKYETPETEKIIGIEYYKAVIQGNVRTYSDLIEWRNRNPLNGIMEW